MNVFIVIYYFEVLILLDEGTERGVGRGIAVEVGNLPRGSSLNTAPSSARVTLFYFIPVKHKHTHINTFEVEVTHRS